MRSYRSVLSRTLSISLALAFAFSIGAEHRAYSSGAVDPDADYDRMDGTGKSGETVQIIEWEGNLEVHVYPPGSLKGLAATLDMRNKAKPVMVLGYRFVNNPKQQFIRRAILGITMTNGFKAYKDPTEGEFDKIIISNNGLSGQVALFKLDPTPTSLYPEGYPGGTAVAKSNPGNGGNGNRAPASYNGGGNNGNANVGGNSGGDGYSGNGGNGNSGNGGYSNNRGNGNSGNGYSGNGGYSNNGGNGNSGNGGYSNNGGNGNSGNGGYSNNGGNGNSGNGGYSNNGGNGNSGNGGYAGNSGYSGGGGGGGNGNVYHDNSQGDLGAGAGYGTPSQEDAPPPRQGRRGRYPAQDNSNSQDNDSGTIQPFGMTRPTGSRGN
jgi:hypothetical protein